MTFICEILITMVNLSAIIIRLNSEPRTHHLRGRRILLAPMVAMLCSSNLAQAVEAQPYYAGKNITMLISTSPGGATDVAGRLVMRHLGKYLPGQPTLIAQNMPGAGGIVCRKDTPYSSVDAMRSAKTPARFGEGGTGSISFVFSSLVGEILDFKVKHVTGYGSAREIDLGLERGE